MGVLTDLSGTFKDVGIAMTAGNQAWADQVNASGGICGRTIEIDIKDHGYKPENAISLYEQQKGSSLGLLQLHGSPTLAALKERITTDEVLSVTGSWSSANLDSPSVLTVGQTYDVEIINGLSWFSEQGFIEDGDTIAHIYADSEYGQNGLLGSKFYAEQHGLNLIEVPVSASDTDMAATVTKLKSQGVNAIALTTSPAAAAGVGIQTKAQSLDVPLLSSNPSFSTTFLSDDQTYAALDRYYVASSGDSLGSENPAAAQLLQHVQEATDDAPNDAAVMGYTFGLAWQAILETACESGDLTREGILAAKQQVSAIDTDGLTGTLDFSVPGAPSSRAGFLAQLDVDAISGTTVVAELYESPEAGEYAAPFEE
ncbi:MAG: ABC transporter substrate-binding protein [Cumulibacter sp.]